MARKTMDVREAIQALRLLHIKQIEAASVAHERLQRAEANDWDDSWRFENDFHEAWFKAAGIFAAIKELEQYT